MPRRFKLTQNWKWLLLILLAAMLQGQNTNAPPVPPTLKIRAAF